MADFARPISVPSGSAPLRCRPARHFYGAEPLGMQLLPKNSVDMGLVYLDTVGNAVGATSWLVFGLFYSIVIIEYLWFTVF